MERGESGATTEVRPVRWGRVALLAAALIVVNAGWIAHSEMKTEVTEITITPLFIGVLFILFLLTVINRLVARLAPRAALTQTELLLLFSALSVATAIAGIGNIGFFTPFLTNAFWYGDAEDWSRWWSLLPPSVGPRDRALLRGFYEGRSTFFRPEALAAWAFPLLFWSGFLLALLVAFLCAAHLLRRRWDEQERLPFPVLALPLELTAERAPLLGNRLLWAGAAIPATLHSLNSLHSLYPALPSLAPNTFRQALDGVPLPWSGLGSIPLMLHPCGVGFGYLVQTDTLFSLLFFWVVKKLLNLLGTSLAWRDPGPEEYGDGAERFPFTGWQAWGAWLTVGVATLWTARGYLRTLRPDERRAAVGAGGGLLAACALLWSVGAPWWLPPVFLGLFGLLILAAARLEAETPVMSLLLAWVAPQGILTGVLGTALLSRRDLAHIATLTWFNIDYRAAIMPQQLHGLVAGARLGVPRRPLWALLLGAGALGLAAALLWDMQLYHTYGAATAQVNGYRINMGKVPFWNLNGWLGGPKPPNPSALLGMGVGSAVTLLLTALRARFVGFPLTPAGYVLTTSFAHEHYWIDMTVALVAKATILRYGGMKLYRAALPFFLGLILGDFVTGAAWSVIGVAMGVNLFRTFPN